jgi:hypothetical protein
MKFFLSLLTLTIASLLSTNVIIARVKSDTISIKLPPCHFLKLSDAVSVLGQPSHLSENVSTQDDSSLTINCTYTADTIDRKTGRTGVLYVAFKEFGSSSAAKGYFNAMQKANAVDPGNEVVKGIGEEAFTHNVRSKMFFIMIRKVNVIIVLKSHNLTSTASYENFIRSAKLITNGL